MSHLEITAESREEALAEALDRLRVPEEALEAQWDQEPEDELLAGARPMVRLTASVKRSYIEEEIRGELEDLLEKMNLEAQIETRHEGEITLIAVESPASEILIGYHGETLDAIQHLAVRMTGLTGRDMPLVLVDVGDYRLRRIERLQRVVEDLSTLVREEGGEEHLDPMDAIDRKIVHTLLKSVEGVTSYSRGEGANRQVVIAPID